MKGSEAQLLVFLEGSNNRYVIPVYQRKYDWKINQCRQLFDDLKKLVAEGRKSISLAALFLRLFQAAVKSSSILLTASSG